MAAPRERLLPLARPLLARLGPRLARRLGALLAGPRGSAFADDAVAEHQGPVALCRRLALVAWDRLPAPDAAERIVVVPRTGAHEIARRVVELYRPDLEIREEPEDGGGPVVTVVARLGEGGSLTVTVGG